jgi:hypothetical protein
MNHTPVLKVSLPSSEHKPSTAAHITGLQFKKTISSGHT